jgi:hypothetical protein
MARTRDYTRKMMFKKAIRKKRLAETHSWNRDFPYYNNLHEYSKNKIHYSCPLCQPKTRNKGHRRCVHKNHSPAINYKASDQRKIDSCTDSINEFYLI